MNRKMIDVLKKDAMGRCFYIQKVHCVESDCCRSCSVARHNVCGTVCTTCPIGFDGAVPEKAKLLIEDRS